jgi:hypothetical protein
LGVIDGGGRVVAVEEEVLGAFADGVDLISDLFFYLGVFFSGRAVGDGQSMGVGVGRGVYLEVEGGVGFGVALVCFWELLGDGVELHGGRVVFLFIYDFF